MRIESLIIDGIGGIRHLELNFIPKMNIICGSNGIGKTTVLDIIADAFSSGTTSSKLKRNAQYSEGKYTIQIDVGDGRQPAPMAREETIKQFQPADSHYHMRDWRLYSRKLLHFDARRNIPYSKLNAVGADPRREDYDTGSMAVECIEAGDIKNWFVNRYLFVDKGHLAREQVSNYHLAERAFGILDCTVTFKAVEASSFDIMLSTAKGDIYFEYLSSGYKSCIYIILGIIKEIEYRTASEPVAAENYDGVILIDEIDLHLHPSWQAGLIHTLKEIFPCAQFILTTHSPSVLQTLNSNEIIALGSNEAGEPYVKELQLGQYGLQGWTLEEILKYVMDMPETTSNVYQETLKRFDEAMNREDRELILREYHVLKEMLHPDNPLRKLLALQVVEWEG